MPGPDLTCAEVEREELDLRYLRDQLPPERAEAFEAHYFACAHCWGLVQGGLEVSATRPPPARRARWAGRWPLLAAATVLTAVGIGLWRAQRPSVVIPPDTERSERATVAGLRVRAEAGGGALSVAWNKVAGAAGYRVRLYRGNGVLLIERDVSDTSLSLPRAGITAPPPFFWQIIALDRLGGELARSPLGDAEPSQLPRSPPP